MFNSTARFSNRVDDYIRYRPGYPLELVECLTRQFGLQRAHVIADVGSGTGISSELFLRNGNPVIGVEPNAQMRAAAEQLLGGRYPGFRSVGGTAEDTGLPDHSVDWIVCAQAFHWFDVPRTRAEFARILRPPSSLAPASGRVVLMWNMRLHDTPFLAAYEQFLQGHATDPAEYAAIRARDERVTDGISQFFGAARFETRHFPNQQWFDFDGLLGRVCSSSYMPARDAAAHPAMCAALERLFREHASATAAGPRVEFRYVTLVFTGRLLESRE